MKIIVKRHPRKTKRKTAIVRRHPRKIKKQGIITKDQRKMFDAMASQPVEIGGELDFGRNQKLERFTSFIGGEDYINFPSDDWEMEHHSHPEGSYPTPSPEDISGFLKSKGNQGMVIFSKGKAVAMIKTDKSKDIKPFKMIKKYNKIYNTSENIEKDVIDKLKGDGFLIKTFKKGKMNIPIRIIE